MSGLRTLTIVPALAAVALTATAATAPAAKRGGTLTVLASGDVTSLDPGRALSGARHRTTASFSAMIAGATHRTLMSFRPGASTRPVPDLAQRRPQVSSDGRTVTVDLRRGVRFGPPVDREVTAADVKYAIERGFGSSVATPYAQLFLGAIAGASFGAPPGTPIEGIETPDTHTLVFRLTAPEAGAVVAAMAMPITAPVPREVALPLDRARVSGYGRRVVATGPYRVRRHLPGRLIELVRNRGWRRSTDFRPARLARIVVREGQRDTVRATRRVLRGRRAVSGDLVAPAAQVARALRGRRSQMKVVRGGAVGFVALNTRLAPFDEVAIRRAVAAGMDRGAAVRVIGGSLAGEVATHFLSPGTPGFAQAGGMAGARQDFLRFRGGSGRMAADYLRRAGHSGGSYDGPPIGMAVASDASSREAGRVVAEQLARLGFRVRTTVVRGIARAASLCTRPGTNVHVCPRLDGWTRDVPDPQSVLEPMFASGSSVSGYSSRAIDDAIVRARAIADPAARAREWAAIDRTVTDLVPAVPLFWSRTPLLRSRDVAGSVNPVWQTWDLSFTALR